MARFASRCRIRAMPKITALVVPLVVPSGSTSDPTSMWPNAFRFRVLTRRTSSVSVSNAKVEFGSPGITVPPTCP